MLLSGIHKFRSCYFQKTVLLEASVLTPFRFPEPYATFVTRFHFFLRQIFLNYGVLPLRIQQTSAQEIAVGWDDQHQSRYTLRHLRKSCPCASCKIEREEAGGAVLLPILKAGEFQVDSIKPVGQYAVQITWGDGHSTGIYTFEYLRSLCECNDCSIPVLPKIH